MFYCIHNDVSLSGWPADVYQQLCVNPLSFDINKYNDLKFRTLKQRLIAALPLIIEKRTQLEASNKQLEQQPQQQVIVKEVVREVPSVPLRPKFDRRYWSRVSALFVD